MRKRRNVREFAPLWAKLKEIWRQYEPYLPGNVMSYRPIAGPPGGTLTNLTPEQYEACLQTLAKMR